MIDPQNGTLSFDQSAITIWPAMTRAEFLTADWAKQASDWVVNEPWHSWKLAGDCVSDNTAFVVVLFFEGEKLKMVDFCNADPAYGNSWSEYTAKKEAERDASHGRWLSACIGTKRSFAWGTVWAGVDERGGGASIVIRYA